MNKFLSPVIVGVCAGFSIMLYWRAKSMADLMSKPENQSQSPGSSTTSLTCTSEEIEARDDGSNLIDYHCLSEENHQYSLQLSKLSLNISNINFTDAYSIFLKYFNNEWPPKATFNDWPNEYKIYSKICDNMPYQLKKLNDIQLFRTWMQNEFNNNIKDVNDELLNKNEQSVVIWQKIETQIESDCKKARSGHNDVLFGLLGCLTKLMLGYRWAILPLNDKNLYQHQCAGNSISFPRYLIMAYKYVSDFYGLQYGPVSTNTLYANLIKDECSNDSISESESTNIEVYDNNTNFRFYLNYKETDSANNNGNNNNVYVNGFRLEKYVLTMFIDSELKILNLINAIKDCLQFFFDNYKNICTNSKLESKYIEMLKNVENEYNNGVKDFGNYFHNKKFPSKNGYEYGINILAWHLGDEIPGVSATQELFVPLTDIFCLNYRNSDLIFKEMNKSIYKGGVMSPTSELLQSLLYTVNLREKLLPIDTMTRKIQKQFYRIVSRIRGFRIVHRNKVNRAINEANATTSVTGTIKVTINNENDNSKQENISKKFYNEMTNIIRQVEKPRNMFYQSQ